MTHVRRLATAMAAVTLLSTACGARLSEEQRADALGTTRTGAVTFDAAGAPVDAGGDSGAPVDADGAPVDAGGDAGAPVDAGGGPAAGGGAGGGAPADGPAAAGGGSGPAAPAGGAPQTGGGAVDTRKAPPGGNGGATDTGVTANQITIANVSDISGAVPGLFEDAQLAVKAYVAYFNAREGTIYGRKLKLLALDSRLDTGANRSASIQACNEAFAGVGSVSGFDAGAAPVIQDCGIPDLRGLSSNNEMKAVPNAYPINVAGKPGDISLSLFGWPAQRFPEAVKKAAYLYIDGEVTRQIAEESKKATTQFLGYDWVYSSAIGITETNYSPFVQQMKSKGVRYVTFVGAYQQAAAIAKEMQRQGLKVDAYIPAVTAYSKDFIDLGGGAAEGTYIAVGGSLNEEIASNPELQLYAQWLNQVEPGARPTGIGQFSWTAAKLFVEKLKAIGPKPTRKAMLAEFAKVNDYTGGGLLAPADIGSRQLNDCVQFVQVKGGKFVRVEPTKPRERRCVDGVVNARSGKRLR